MSGIDRVHYVPGLSPQSTHKVQPTDRERKDQHPDQKKNEKNPQDQVELHESEDSETTILATGKPLPEEHQSTLDLTA